MSGIIDIHVLEETVARVSKLTDSIARQATVVSESTQKARSSLGPAGQRSRNLEDYKQRTKLILNRTEDLQKRAEALNSAAKVRGPEGIAALNREIDSLAQSPYYRQFYGLIDAANNVKRQGLAEIENKLESALTAMFEPVDGRQYMGASRPLPEYDMQDASNVREAVAELDALKAQERVDHIVSDALSNYITQSVSQGGDQVTATSLKPFGALVEALNDHAKEGLTIVLMPNTSRHARLMKLIDKTAETELSKVSRSIAKAAKAAPVVPPVSQQRGMPPMGMQQMAPNTPGNRISGASASSGGKRKSDALTGPKILSSPKTPGGPNSMIPGPPMGGPVTPGGGPRPPSADYKSTPGGQAPPSVPVSTPVAPGPPGMDWSLFELIDSARNTKIDPAELESYKQDGLRRLTELFPVIESRVLAGPIGSEPGLAPGTTQVLSLLRGIGTEEARAGVEVVLAEVSVRAYVANPKPLWVTRTPEPSPEARAYPLQLFVADCIEQFMWTLKQRGDEVFKGDHGRKGIFALINISAVDHAFSSNGLSIALGDVGKDRIKRLSDGALKEILTDWNKLGPYLMDAKVTSSGSQSTKLSSKDREVVKEKFRQFNTEFEVLVERHKRYKISDPALRKKISDEIRKLLVPLYGRFYDKHRGGDFTKNIDKYIRWDKVQLEGVIASL